MFTPEQANKISALGHIVRDHLNQNDKRVANGIQEALEMLAEQLASPVASPADTLKKNSVGQFERLFGLDPEESIETFMLACYNTAQYDRALEICALAEKYELLPKDEILEERAELYGHLGQLSKAEKILSDFWEQDPEDVWNYIRFGDLYWTWQVLPEKQNLQQAESWYYKALNKQVGAGTEDGVDLLERLGDVCVERLRRSSEKRLLEMLEQLHIGSWRTLGDLQRTVYLTGPDSVVFNHLQMEIFHKISGISKAKGIEKANECLRTLMNAYNLIPQRYLNELCPFQMSEYYSQGEHTSRIVAEKMQAFIEAMSAGQVQPPTGAEEAEGFSDFQEKFMQGRDGLTGKKRSEILAQEQKQIKKLIDKGEFIWTGFLKFRSINDLSELYPES